MFLPGLCQYCAIQINTKNGIVKRTLQLSDLNPLDSFWGRTFFLEVTKVKLDLTLVLHSVLVS